MFFIFVAFCLLHYRMHDFGPRHLSFESSILNFKLTDILVFVQATPQSEPIQTIDK